MTTKNFTSPQQWQTDFAAALSNLEEKKNRGILAQLRRGQGKGFGEEPRRDAWVLTQLRRQGRANFTDEWEVNRCCLIASLFAEHSADTGSGSIGAAFRRMASLPGGSEEAVERRFYALLDSDEEDLPKRLRYAIALLKSKGVPLDWAQLLADVTNWNRPSRSVQKRWSMDFWGAVRQQAGDSDASESMTPSISKSEET
ncbi:MAG: type I-E CRISPR-associated protein Cse2/CasB [Planctomycetaceae bacterium]